VLYVYNKIDILRVGTCNKKTLNKKEKKSHVYLDLQMATRTQIHLSRKDVVSYFVKVMKHYKDKEMLVVPFNTGNHWVILSISTNYDQVCYRDSSRLIGSKTDDRLTRDWSDGISFLDA
jgi:hypothetical protein